jgi:hypothetical protein
MQAAEFDHLFLFRVVVAYIGSTQPDVGAAAGHLRRHRHGPELAGFGDH